MSRALLDTPMPSSGSSSRPPELEIFGPDGTTSRVELAGQQLVVGRAPECGLRLEGGTVSRQHAEIFRDPFGRWWVRDLGSRNGVKVNGERVTERVLQPGSSFQLGGYRLTFRLPVPVAASSDDPDITSVGTVTYDDSVTGEFSTLEDGNDAPRISAAHLSELMRFGRDLLDIDNQHERLKLLCAFMVRDAFHGHSALVFRLRRQIADAPPQVLCGPTSSNAFYADDTQAPYLSRNLVRHLRHSGQPVLASNMSRNLPAEAIEVSISPDVVSVSAVACPVGEPTPDLLDVLYVTLPPQYGTPEWLAVASLAAEQHRLAENAWAARMHAERHAMTELELRRAKQIQTRLVPKQVSVPGLDVAVGFEACRWVGGDYADVAPTNDGRLLLAIADVCGKGMPAALIATSLRTMVRTGLRAGMDLPDLIAAIRPQLADTIGEESFVTMAAVFIEPQSGALRSVNAGHPAAFIVNPEGQVRHLPSAENFPLGISFEAVECREERLATGEMLVMFTDGVSELSNPSLDMLGTARFAAEVAAIYAADATVPAAELVNKVTAALDLFRAGRPNDDDQTFVLAKRV
jgi:sigma-B regulation protein RsbU (phosphoserine phosphatase)